MRIAAAILLVLGLLLGPGYHLYGQHFNGRESLRVELTERAERWTMPDGTIQRFPGRRAYRPVELPLHPERNLAVLALTFHIAPGSSSTSEPDVYLATLFDMDRPALQREIRLDAAPGKEEHVVLPPQIVRSPVTHLFVLEELNEPTRPVSRITLVLREQAEPFVERLVTFGIGLLIAGVLLLVHDRFKAQGQRR